MAKLLFVVQQYAPEIGGLATSGTRISRTLAALGHEVHVVVLSSELDSGEAESEEFETGLFVHRFGRSKQIDFTLQQLSIFYEWLHQKHRFDAVWGHYAWQMGFSAIWFAKANGLPSVLSLRGNDVDRQLFPPGDFSRLAWMLENATELVSVSKDLAEKVKTINGCSATVMYNAVDSKRFSPGEGPNADARRVALREELGGAPEELLLVFSVDSGRSARQRTRGVQAVQCRSAHGDDHSHRAYRRSCDCRRLPARGRLVSVAVVMGRATEQYARSNGSRNSSHCLRCGGH